MTEQTSLTDQERRALAWVHDASHGEEGPIPFPRDLHGTINRMLSAGAFVRLVDMGEWDAARLTAAGREALHVR